MTTISVLNNGESDGIIRGKINNNFSALNDDKLETTQVLTKTNTTPYTPTTDYHPATKIYADTLKTNWESAYDPNGYETDVYDRENHTGTQLPSTIATDSSNRFVTDTQINDWNSKEDAIGAKGTAFNKNFGTLSGEVAEGNHTHTKADVGLGNVDNTSDVNKPVSTAQQTALDAKLDDTVAEFVVQTSNPSHAEGKTFYSDEWHSLVTYSDMSGVPHIHGQMSTMRVINKTGVSISKGKACRHDGVDITTSLPKIKLAIATSIADATVLGVAAETIANNAEGWIITHGPIYDFNTSAYSVGVPIYLSATSAGDYTNTPPDLVTQVGGILISDASLGSAMVSIINNISIPAVIGIFQDPNDTYDLSLVTPGDWITIDNFNTSESLLIDIDAVNGIMTVPGTGWYRGTLNINLTSDEDPPSGIDTINFRIYDTTSASSKGSTTLQIPSSSSVGDTFSRAASFLFQANNEEELVLQMSSLNHTGTITFTDLSSDLASINIRA